MKDDSILNNGYSERVRIEFSYGPWAEGTVPDSCIREVLSPRMSAEKGKSDRETIEYSILHPIGTLSLQMMVRGRKQVLILVDDYTRLTPASIILPLLLSELKKGGIQKKQVKILVASGTHRGMNDEEKRKKCGDEIVDSIPVLDHTWYDESHMITLDPTAQGTEISLNRLLVESDFVIGLGHIVPHRVAGFSGGAKIVQPGVCGAVTTGQTHWLSAARFSGREIMGVRENPVRKEIDEVGIKAGLAFIVNTIQSGDESVHSCVSGHPVAAHRIGCGYARKVYGCEFAEFADIVVADAYPSTANMWQASKGVYSADLAMKEDGVLILVTPCPEGVAREHPEIELFGYSNPDRIEEMVDEGELHDLTIAAHILHVGRVITGKRRAILVSPGISRKIAEHIGFIPAADLQEAIDLALLLKGKDASLIVIRHGGEVMPVHLGQR